MLVCGPSPLYPDPKPVSASILLPQRFLVAALLTGIFLSPLRAQSTAAAATSATSHKALPVTGDAATPAPSHKPSPAASSTAAAATAATNAAAIERLTQSNQDLLDLLKKQQAVLEDLQFDRRLQSRQISSLEDRLEETLQQNSQLQVKIAKLETQLSTASTLPPGAATPSATVTTLPAKTADAPPPPPATYLQPAEPEGPPGTKSWHRLFSLSGIDSKNTDVFHVQSRQWRVLWHNQDKEGKEYANTSALFLNAFPKGDTIPQKVCAKVGSGGDITELDGPGNFYLKIEASGGAWELAVEDFK